jgi:hypothetical protein
VLATSRRIGYALGQVGSAQAAATGSPKLGLKLPPPTAPANISPPTSGCRLSDALALSTDRGDLPASVLVVETLKKRSPCLYRTVPAPLRCWTRRHIGAPPQADKRNSCLLASDLTYLYRGPIQRAPPGAISVKHCATADLRAATISVPIAVPCQASREST